MDESGEAIFSPDAPQSFTELFERDCPYYLAMGMTYEQYWYGDVWMIKAYREADKLCQERQNQEAWLQGMYFYEGVSVAIYNAMRGKGQPPKQYASQPYEFGSSKKKPELDDGMTKEDREILIAKIALDNERRRRKGTM